MTEISRFQHFRGIIVGKKEKKNQAVSAKFTGLNTKEANKIASEMKKIKQKHAPDAKGTIMQGNQKKILAGPGKKKKRLD